MTDLFLSKRFGFALAFGTVAALGSSIAFADGPVLPLPGQNHVKIFGPGQKVQFSAPSDPLNTTNILNATSPTVNPLNPPPSAFKQVQDDLFRPLGNALQPVDSMQGVMSVPVEQQEPQRPKSRRAREREDALRNWAFTDLNDLDPQPTANEMLGVKDIDEATGKEKQATSAMEKYLNRADQKQQQDGDKTTWQKIEDRQARQMVTGTNVYDPTAQPYLGNDYYQKTIFSPGDFSGNSGANGNANVSSFSGQKFDPQQAEYVQTQADKDRDSAFKHLLDRTLPASSPTGSPFGVPGLAGVPGLNEYANPASAVLATGQQNTSPFRSPLDPIAAIPDPNNVLHSSVLDNPTYKALGMPQPATTLPAPAPPPQKTALSIEKMIDPFAANVYKPKF